MIQGLLKTAALAVILTGCEAREAAQPASTANTANTAQSTTPANEPPLAKTASDPALQWGPCPQPFPSGCEIAVLHGDPAKPNADIFLRVPGGTAIPAHSHTSPERMILASGSLRVKYQGHPEAMLQPGSYAYGPAGLPHEANCAAGAACTLFVAFEGPVDMQPFSGAL